MRRLFPAIAVAALLVAATAADELPSRAPGEAMEFEPGLLPDLANAPEPVDSAGKLEAALERAKRSAASGERMFRAGIIAKVEAEKRTLKVVKLTNDLASAQLEAAKADLIAKRAEFDAGKLSQEALDAAQSAVDTASQNAATAAAAWQRAELAAAELNLSRQRQLLAAGIGSKSLVARAQSQVAGLKNKSGTGAADAR